MFSYYKQIMEVPAGDVLCKGCLTIPVGAPAIIVFAQSGGYTWQSNESALLEQRLQKAGFGTLVIDLVSEEEGIPYGKGMDLDLLTHRLILVTEWLMKIDKLGKYRYGFLSAHTGAVAAIKAAAAMPGKIGAIVCRSGRFELAMQALKDVGSPTLLIAGTLDRYIASMNREALDQLPGDKALELIGGADHRFLGGTIEQVAEMTTAWFKRHLHAIVEHEHGQV